VKSLRARSKNRPGSSPPDALLDKEYKKIRVRYYTDDFFEWERRHLAGDGSGNGSA